MECCESLRLEPPPPKKKQPKKTTLQKQLRKFLVFIAKVPLLTAKPETGFQFCSGDTSLRDQCSLDLAQDTFRDIQIHDLSPFEKDRKSEQAGCLGSSYT